MARTAGFVRAAAAVWSSLSLCLALQTLGGDPQSAYFIGLMAGAYGLGLALSRAGAYRFKGWLALGLLAAWGAAVLGSAYVAGTIAEPPAGPPGSTPPNEAWISPRLWDRAVLLFWAGLFLVLYQRLKRAETGPGLGLRGRFLGLAGAALVAFLIMGVQILPTLEFTRLTVRAAEDGSHGIFPFSLEPWRLAELLWPTPFGDPLTNRYWMPAIPPLHAWKIWVPSLYMGVLTIVLALSSLRLRRGDTPARTWLTFIALAALLLSLGQFASPLWAARNIPALVPSLGPHDPLDYGELRRDGFLADGFGSPYWILAWTCPGFRSFRYPAKLLTFSSLALAGLAGFGWDELLTHRRKRALILTIVLTLSGLALLALTHTQRGPIERFWATLGGPGRATSFGPFDPSGALSATRDGLTHGILALVATLAVILLARFRPRSACVAALLVLTVDLALGNGRFVHTVPQSLVDLKNVPEALERIAQAERDDPSAGPYRIHRMPIWEPLAWRSASSPDRLKELVAWERATIQPKYAIPYGANYTLTEGTAELYDYWYFFAPFLSNTGPEMAQALGLPPGSKPVYYPRRGYDLWNTRYFILPYYPVNDENRGFYSFLPDTEPVYPRPEQFEGPDGTRALETWVKEHDWQILRNRAAYPRAWVVHQVRRVAPISGMSREGRTIVVEEILYPSDELWNSPGRSLWNPRQIAWLEIDPEANLQPQPSGGQPNPDEQVNVQVVSPVEVRLDVDLKEPGIVVLSDVYYPGWTLQIDGQDSTMLRVNRVMQRRGRRGWQTPDRVPISTTIRPARLDALWTGTGHPGRPPGLVHVPEGATNRACSDHAGFRGTSVQLRLKIGLSEPLHPVQQGFRSIVRVKQARMRIHVRIGVASVDPVD